MEYQIAKWLHIVSSTLLFGTGIGSAYYMLLASWRGEPKAVAFVVRYVVLADWLFTATTVVIQPLTGFWLMHLAGYPLSSTWISVSLMLYALAVACWLPVVWMQMRMRDLAQDAVDRDRPLSGPYWRYLKFWILLGTLAFFAFLAIFWLMVAKPA